MKAILLALLERLVIDWLIYQVDRLEIKLEKKKLDLEKRLPQDRINEKKS
jgi:hypothetical protein